jgi:uncharacterized protein YaeQ
MAFKATICNARVQLSDLDRNVYRNHALTIVRHPSESNEQLPVRLLVFALDAPGRSG